MRKIKSHFFNLLILSFLFSSFSIAAPKPKQPQTMLEGLQAAFRLTKRILKEKPDAIFSPEGKNFIQVVLPNTVKDLLVAIDERMPRFKKAAEEETLEFTYSILLAYETATDLKVRLGVLQILDAVPIEYWAKAIPDMNNLAKQLLTDKAAPLQLKGLDLLEKIFFYYYKAFVQFEQDQEEVDAETKNFVNELTKNILDQLKSMAVSSNQHPGVRQEAQDVLNRIVTHHEKNRCKTYLIDIKSYKNTAPIVYKN